MGSANCTGVDVSFSSAAAGSFTDLGAGATPSSLPSNSGTAQYNSIGPKDITFAGNTFPRFWTILTAPEAINLQILTEADTLCVGEIVAVSSERFALSYEWSVSYGGQIIATGSRDSIRFTAAQPGSYTLRLRVETDCCGWIGPVEKKVEVIPAPEIRAQGASGCFPLLLRAELVSGSPGGKFIWYNQNGDSVGEGAELLLPGPTASPTYTVVYRAGACRSPAVSVPVQGRPTPVISGIRTVPPLSPAPEGPVEITFTASYVAPPGYSVVLSWNFGDGTSPVITTDSTITHTYAPGFYELTLIAGIEECRDTLTLQVVVRGQRQLVIPNVFSPNGDGINDEWFPKGSGIRTIQVQIYDRWGKLIYQGNTPWRGDNAIEGAYTYVVRVAFLDGTEIERAGTVTLLR
ncbi:MAG: gliding motility-associated C-terminal domain-containing protein [Bacteroidia bacterium]|nr:gliding motility-associated C-terminal domain-containing protein [Bacteroidia bacterium]